MDEDIIKNENNLKFAGILKDYMRDHELVSLVQLWYVIIKQTHSTTPECARFCLEVIDRYIHWIPLNLIVNNEFLELFEIFLNNKKLQKETVDCYYEILKKRMPSKDKIKLIESIKILQLVRKSKSNKNTDSEYALKLAELLTRVMTELIIACRDIDYKLLSNLFIETIDLSFYF
eukprot:UN25036